eukprot:gb/GEZN01016752.1/.p1 GENE.gb/GEZN01016752.1/~~gb/GEZN01016752.1/.p1  ORF type:complete len:218 (+),score=27.25 gb/GEZN01016752.1/:114-767(+)
MATEDDDDYEYVYEEGEEPAAQSRGGNSFGLDLKAPSGFTGMGTGGLGGLDIKPVEGKGIYKNDGFDYLTPGKSIGRVKHRNWSERLFFETGTCYMSGALLGGVFGAYQGFYAAGPTPYWKLKANSVMNYSGKLASTTANSFGVFALIYSCSRSFAKNQRRQDDPLNDVIGVGVAGFLVGAPKGFRPALAGSVSLAFISVAMLKLHHAYQKWEATSS